MSFGAVTASCPCGSGVTFAECCRPLLDGAPAPDAERLMRSRYTAFARGDVAYLVRTWHPRTRPETIDLDADLRWTRLEVLEVEAEGDAAHVAFRAHWRNDETRGVLAERSRFARRGGRWLYVDGEISAES